jgi:transcriptional regulator with XRE-family HTH domain
VTTYVGSFFKARRMEKGWAVADLARNIGYKNVTKGANRIHRLEQRGTIPDELLPKLMDALEIDSVTLQKLKEEDRRAYVKQWETWADEPAPIQVVARVMPAMYQDVELPPGANTEEAAVAFAQALARQDQSQVFVILSRRKTLLINEEGLIVHTAEATPDFDPRPYSQVGNKKFFYRFDENNVHFRMRSEPPPT